MPINAASILAGMQPGWTLSKASQTAEGAGTCHSLWKAAGTPGAGSNPPLLSAGSGYVPTRTTAGALPFTNPAAGNAYLACLDAWGPTAGALVLYDRLWACSGFGTVITTAQTITTPGNAGRSTSWDGVEAFLEVYTAPGATGANWTVTYTNAAGTSGRTSVYSHPANAESVGQMIPLVLAAGDTGVQSVQSFQASVSSGTAGDIGITLVRRIATIPIAVAGGFRDAFSLGIPRVQNDACVAAMVLCSTTNTGLLMSLGSFAHVVP
jgi:hypothetical protein